MVRPNKPGAAERCAHTECPIPALLRTPIPDTIMTDWSNIPYYGAGIGFRQSLMADIARSAEEIDFLEVISDNFFDPARHDLLHSICERFSVIAHGVGLSIGSADGVEPAYIEKVKTVSDITGSPYYSEHLCHTRAPGIDIGHLSPIWFTDELLEIVVASIDRIQQALGKPMVLENVSYVFNIPDADMSQADFFHKLVERTGCGILLDVTNVFINSVNHGHSPVALLDRMPLDHVLHLHIAGGRWYDGLLIDSHTAPVQEGSWNLLAELLDRTSVRGLVLEHDADFPRDFSVLTDQLARARSMMDAAGCSSAASGDGVPRTATVGTGIRG